MALRKDKVSAALQAMKGICSSPEDSNSLPNTINQLADILGNLFDDIALPELPQIDSGEFGFPDDAPFDFPTGGGDMPPFDPLGGFEGGTPGGGEEFGPGGEGPDQVWQDGDPCAGATPVNVTYLAETTEEIPAAKDGIPGIGSVKLQVAVPENQLKLTECRQKCVDNFGKDIKEIDKQIAAIQKAFGTVLDGVASTVTLSSAIVPTPLLNANPTGTINLTGSSNDKIDELKRLKFEQEKLFNQCLAKCRKEDNKNNVGDEIVAGARLEDIGIAEAKNISCEKIESGTQVVVSGTIIEPSGCGEDDLYVMVEACGCDDEEEE